MMDVGIYIVHGACMAANGAPPISVTAQEEPARTAWQAHFGRFALKELNKDLEIKAGRGTTQVRGDGIDKEIADAVFVQAVAARLGDDGPLDADQRALLSATP